MLAIEEIILLHEHRLRWTNGGNKKIALVVMLVVVVVVSKGVAGIVVATVQVMVIDSDVLMGQ